MPPKKESKKESKKVAKKETKKGDAGKKSPKGTPANKSPKGTPVNKSPKGTPTHKTPSKHESPNASGDDLLSHHSQDQKKEPTIPKSPKPDQTPNFPGPAIDQSNIEIRDRMCIHHNKPLEFYCESCEEPICN